MSCSEMSEETSYKVIRLIEQNPEISQRKLASELGISLGKTNYCIRALVEKGWVKANNFKNSKNRLAYAYLLTPKGLDEKAKVTARFLKRKLAEYESLKQEIEDLKREVQRITEKKGPDAGSQKKTDS